MEKVGILAKLPGRGCSRRALIKGVSNVSIESNMGGATPAASEDRIGEYRFLRMIHPGVNSLIMEVVHESSQRHYAMKQLLASRGEDPSERKAFEFEAKIGRELQHPCLLRVHDFVKDPLQPYFTMDFFPSKHLRLPISAPTKHEMPRTQLHRIITQVATALAYMHDLNWIHRDIKPENIIFNKSGEAKLIDYAFAMHPIGGLSKLFGAKPKRQGTPSYMSPEQIRCLSPTPAADIYSFGITCYEIACGRQPFRANSQNELLKKHIGEKPTPLASFNKDVTPEYADLVMKMIQKKPADRIPDMHEFLSKFSRMRIFKDDAPPPGFQAGLGM